MCRPKPSPGVHNSCKGFETYTLRDDSYSVSMTCVQGKVVVTLYHTYGNKPVAYTLSSDSCPGLGSDFDDPKFVTWYNTMCG